MSKLMMVGACLLLLMPFGSAAGATFGAGASGGMNFPIVQFDQGNGTVFGARGIVTFMPPLSAEAYVNFGKYGEADFEEEFVTDDLDGSNVTSFGLDAKIGAPLGSQGFQPFGTVGLGFFNTSREQTEVFQESSTDLGWVIGAGIAVGVSPKVSIEVRGKLNIVPSEGDASKKSAFVMGGVNYFIGGN